MAYFLGKETTTAPINNQTPTTKTASSSASLTSCDKIMNQCLIDATTFEEKQRCRTARDACAIRANTTQTLMPTEQTPMPKTTVAGDISCGPSKPCPNSSDKCVNGFCVPVDPGPKPPNPTPPPPPPPPNGCLDGCALTESECMVKCGGNSQCRDNCAERGLACKAKCNADADPGVGCVSDAYCITKHGKGWKCVIPEGATHGLCRGPAPSKCTPGKKCTGPKRPNSQCGGLTCFRPESWDGKDESVPGKCYCNTGAGQDGGDGSLGEYKYPSNPYEHMGEYGYPAGMQELMSLLLGRGKELLGMPLGYSQEAMDKMFGLGFEGVRGQERGAREQLLGDLSRQGMSGTGTALGKTSDLAWNTENSITALARTLFVGNEEKKKADLLDYTSAAQGIMGGGGLQYENLLEDINSGRRGETFNIEQLQEAINAARRGEGTQSLMLLMQLLGILGG